MSLKNKRLLLIGGGNMGSALAAGLLNSGQVRPSQIFVTDVRKDLLASLKKRYRVGVGTSNRTAVPGKDIVLLCVKPQQMPEVLGELKSFLRKDQLVISIAAGIRTRFIEQRLESGIPVIRVMPNTPALLRAGALVYCLGRRAKSLHDKLAQAVLSSVGRVWKTSEVHMDAVTALSGSGPAYVFFLVECLARAGARLKLPPPLAEALARQTVYGAGLMLQGSPEPAAVLRERVTSPGGTTAAALKVLEQKSVRRIFDHALHAACQRSRELSGR